MCEGLLKVLSKHLMCVRFSQVLIELNSTTPTKPVLPAPLLPLVTKQGLCHGTSISRVRTQCNAKAATDR